MGAAIPVMHYTGMAAASFTFTGEAPDLSHAVSVSSLGITGITIVTLMVLGLAVLTSVIDRRFSLLESSEVRLRLIINTALDAVITTECGRPDHELELRGRENLRVVFSGGTWPTAIRDDHSATGFGRITSAVSNASWGRVRG